MRRLPAAILALLGYLALSLLLTWPLARHLTTHAPGNGTDDPAILWNLWWVRFSLTVLRQNPFQSDFLFWPLGINLVFYTLTVLNALLSIPVQLSVGLVAANSFVVLFELSIAGLGMFLLAAHLLARHNDLWGLSRSTRAAVAFVAGAAFTFAASRFVYLSLGQFNIAASHWVPWMVLAAVRLGDTPDGARRRRAALLAGLFLLFNGWTEFTYASFLLIFLGLLWAWHALWSLRSGRWRRVVQISIGYLAVLLLFLAGMSPILWQMFQDLRTEGDFLVEGLGFANVFSNDLLGFLVPTHLHPIFGRMVAEGLDFAYLNFAYIGWALVLLAGVALLGRARGAGAFWATGAVVFGLLSLGPTLRLNGRELDLPLPFDLLLQLPFFKANRYPSRYSVMIALCLAVLSAYGLATLVRWLGRDTGARSRTWVGPAVSLTALVLVLFETLSVPLPLSDFRVPAIYREIRDDPGAAVLEVPVAWRNGFRVTGTLDPAFMYAQFYQTVHEKHIPNGNTSRNPELKFQYFTEAPLFNRLIALETGHVVVQSEWLAELARADFDLLGANYVVVHKVGSSDPAVTPEATIPFLESVLPIAKRYEDERLVVYQRDTQATPTTRLDLDGNDASLRLMLGEGWGALPPLDPTRDAQSATPLVWAQRAQARLLLPLAPGRESRLILDLFVPGAGQQLQVSTRNGLLPGSPLSLRSGWNQVEVVVPPALVDAAVTELRLEFALLWPNPAGASDSDSRPATSYQVGTSGVASPASVVVESAGQEVGDFAHIYVNGADAAANTIGYNVVVIDAQSGAILASAAFDTAFDPSAGAALAAFVDGVPAGALVAVAANDTVVIPADKGGTLPFDARIVRALETIGATGDLTGGFRWSHAILGTKGAPPGSAAEDLSEIRPARVWAGELLTGPQVAAALGRLRVTAAPTASN